MSFSGMNEKFEDNISTFVQPFVWVPAHFSKLNLMLYGWWKCLYESNHDCNLYVYMVGFFYRCMCTCIYLGWVSQVEIEPFTENKFKIWTCLSPSYSLWVIPESSLIFNFKCTASWLLQVKVGFWPSESHVVICSSKCMSPLHYIQNLGNCPMTGRDISGDMSI